jgi:hypothetical protein
MHSTRDRRFGVNLHHVERVPKRRDALPDAVRYVNDVVICSGHSYPSSLAARIMHSQMCTRLACAAPPGRKLGGYGNRSPAQRLAPAVPVNVLNSDRLDVPVESRATRHLFL